MDPEYKRTKDHDTIRAWIEEHGGQPAVVPGIVDDELLDIIFHDDWGGLQPIPWEEFFDRFDTVGLTFHYLDEVEPGDEKRAYNFLTDNNPSEIYEDETELPEVNELAEENLRNDFNEPTALSEDPEDSAEAERRWQ